MQACSGPSSNLLGTGLLPLGAGRGSLPQGVVVSVWLHMCWSYVQAGLGDPRCKLKEADGLHVTNFRL